VKEKSKVENRKSKVKQPIQITKIESGKSKIESETANTLFIYKLQYAINYQKNPIKLIQSIMQTHLIL